MAETKEMLVPIDEYLKSGIHIGTKFKTKHMDQFIYKARPDGLFILNLQKIDEYLRIFSGFLSKYAPEEIIIVSRRENSWKAVKAFGRAIGCRVFAGRYPPGMLVNPQLEIYREAKMLLVTDAWPDRNAVLDSVKVGIPVIALCDTNNQTNFLDFVIPCNNKGKKSLGLLFYILTKEFLKAKGKLKEDEDIPNKIEDFTEE